MTRDTRSWRVSLHLVLWCLVTVPLIAQQAFVSGIVRNESGAGLGGMIVAAYTVDGNLAQTQVSQAQGRYTLSLQPASYRVLAYDESGMWATDFYREASSFETSAVLTLAPGQQLQVDFRLRRGWTVTGNVVRPQSAPDARSVVAAYNVDGTRRGFNPVGADGGYQLTLPEGTYRFATYDEDGVLATQFYQNEITFDRAATVAVESNRSGISFVPVRGGIVIGQVVDDQTRQPLADARVRAFLLDGTEVVAVDAGSDGRFRLTLPPERFKFSASSADGDYETSYFDRAPSFAAAPSFTVAAGQTLGPLVFEMTLAEATQTMQSWWVPVVASTRGAGDTFFLTDVWIHNPGTSTIDTVLTYLPPSGSGLERRETIVTIPAGTQVELRDILGTQLGLTGGGAVRIDAPQPVIATSRTFNRPPNFEQIGTFGLSLPGLPLSGSLSVAILPGLTDRNGNRTNVGLVNPHAHSLTVELRLMDGVGNLLGEGMVTLDGESWIQLNTIFTFLGATGGTLDAVLQARSSDGSFFSYASVVDAKSGDGTIILPAADPTPDPTDP